MKRTELRRGTSRLKSKPKRWTPEEKAERDLTSKRSGGWCEVRIKGVCLGAATNKQHRLAEGQGGPTVVANLLDVCGMGNLTGCHGYIHQHPNEAKENGWIVKPGQDFRKRPVLMFDGFVLLGDDGHRYDPPHRLGCAVWKSDDEPCDCEATR